MEALFFPCRGSQAQGADGTHSLWVTPLQREHSRGGCCVHGVEERVLELPAWECRRCRQHEWSWSSRDVPMCC